MNIKIECSICFNAYDLQDRTPYSLVPCGHTFCDMCIANISNRECPNDRCDFYSRVRNWEIIKFIRDSNNNDLFNTASNDPIINTTSTTTTANVNNRVERNDTIYNRPENHILIETNTSRVKTFIKNNYIKLFFGLILVYPLVEILLDA